MIKYIRLKNFFSFKEETINLKSPISVLLGINGAGKSNLLKAFQFISEGIKGNLLNLILDQWGGFDAIVYKGIDSNNTNEIEIEIGINKDLSRYGFIFHKDLIYRIRITKSKGLNNYYISECISFNEATCNYSVMGLLNFENGEGLIGEIKFQEKFIKTTKRIFNNKELAISNALDENSYNAINTIKKALESIDIYSIFDTSINSKLRKSVRATGSKKLEQSGGNLPMVLNTIKINNKLAYNNIIKGLKVVNGNFKDIDFNILGTGNIELMIDEANMSSSIHVSHMSDGTLKYLCLLAVLYNPNIGNFIILEEPETGLHPDMQSIIADAIKEASQKSKILFTTQSEKLLDAFNLENVIVVEKAKDNYSITKTFSDNDFKDWYDEYFLGEMWSKGDLGGVRW